MQVTNVLKSFTIAAALTLFAVPSQAQNLTFVGIDVQGGDAEATLLLEAQPGGIVRIQIGPYVAPPQFPNDLLRVVPEDGRLILTLRMANQALLRFGHLPVQIDVYHGTGACTFQLDFLLQQDTYALVLRMKQACGMGRPLFAPVGGVTPARIDRGAPPAQALVGSSKQ